MKSLAGASLLLASAYAHSLPELSIYKRETHADNGAKLHGRAIGTHQIQRRAGTVESNIFDVNRWSLGGAYYANVTVGTPPQPQTVILDTGSSDTYFSASNASQCELAESNPLSCRGGTFDSSKSSTFDLVHPAPAFNASFGDGTTAIGPYGEDVFGIGNVRISPVEFGIAETINSTTGFSIGLMGIGYSDIEAVSAARYFYPNVPEVLTDSGVINSRLYSVYLNDDRALQGSVLFGGIDKSRYTGDIATLDFLPTVLDGEIVGVIQFITTVTAASVTSSGNTQTLWEGGSDGISAYGQDNTALPVLLDTGSTAWTLPSEYYEKAIAPAFPFVDQGFCSCQYASSGDYLTLEFGGKVSVKVDVSEFIVPFINTTTGQPVPFDNQGNEACVFLLQPESSLDSGMNFQTLGQAILRSMYVVFDLDNGQASIAQAAVNSTSSPDVVTVQAGPSGVAKAISGVATAPPNSYSIAPAVTVSTNEFSVSTISTAVGTATGAAAIPADGQTSGGSSSSTTSSAAAMAVGIPTADFTGLWVSCVCMLGVAMGAGLML